IGVGIGLHRYFSHHAFETCRAGRILLALWATWALQGPIRRWVADHRRHHRFSDVQFDPHSPFWREDGPIPSRLAGWLHAHLLWMLRSRPSREGRYAPEIGARTIPGWFSRFYWPVAASGLLLPAVAGQ